jgi:hypothetical protein
MNLCSNDHEEVCYIGRNCPVCELQDRLTDAEKLNDSLEVELNEK